MDIYTTPLLTARDAARHLKMPESTLDAWIAAPSSGEPLIHAVTPERRGWPRLPFIAIIEAYVLRALRDQGAPMAEIRAAAEAVRHDFKDRYALASKKIATAGVDLFVELVDESLLHVKTNQLTLRETVADHLRFITWDDAGKPQQLRLRQYPESAQVIIDPRFGWGAPVLASTKVPVEAIVSLWRAGEPMNDVAEEFDLPIDVIEDVLRAAS